MTTDETELTTDVDLCRSDGSLNPDALGWSRQPLHRANLAPFAGGNKRWDYWAVLAGDLLVSVLYANVDVGAAAEVWWADLDTGTRGGTEVISGDTAAFPLPERPGTTPLTVDRDGLRLAITDDGEGTRLAGIWTEADGRPAGLDVIVASPAGHESLNVVIPWEGPLFNYTSKHQARPVVGELVVGERHHRIGGAAGDAWGVLDVGRGRWPARIVWNWGGGAGRSGGHVVGLQFGARWTEGSGFTENGFMVDGRLTKIGRELDWSYDWDDPMAPWRIVDPGGQLDVVLHPRFDKHSGPSGPGGGTETHQVFGRFSGTVRTDDGAVHRFEDLQGFAEEARKVW
ncbi:MAG: DUF2804 domain-containing protein [Acidimicrobiales bacterium]